VLAECVYNTRAASFRCNYTRGNDKRRRMAAVDNNADTEDGHERETTSCDVMT